MKRFTSLHLLRACTAFAVLATCACLETFVADDVSFDRWCGDTLCDWEVDAGSIEKVATWHDADTGVRLAGSEAQISQVQSFDDESCIRFELIADVEAKTRTTLQLDYNADGTVDVTRALPTEPWAPAVFIERAPERYRGVRFILHKAAPGRAVISQMAPSSVDPSECAGPPLELDPQGEGAGCTRDAQCAEGSCAGGYCSSCAADGTCSRGEGCSEDAHCRSGACTIDVCSACGSDGDCAAGEACAFTEYPMGNQRACVDEGALERRGLGQPCVRDSQCRDGYECTATSETLTPRCGGACANAKDDACGAGAACREILASIDEDWNADNAWVCVSPDDCDNAVLCLDSLGESIDF